MTEIKSAIVQIQTEMIKDIDIPKSAKTELANQKALHLAIRSLQAWEEVLTELENMRDIIWQDTDSDSRIVRANAWDKNEILVEAIDTINQHLEIEE